MKTYMLKKDGQYLKTYKKNIITEKYYFELTTDLLEIKRYMARHSAEKANEKLSGQFEVVMAEVEDEN